MKVFVVISAIAAMAAGVHAGIKDGLGAAKSGDNTIVDKSQTCHGSLKNGEEGYCTEDCPCDDAEGPCAYTFDDTPPGSAPRASGTQHNDLCKGDLVCSAMGDEESNPNYKSGKSSSSGAAAGSGGKDSRPRPSPSPGSPGGKPGGRLLTHGEDDTTAKTWYPWSCAPYAPPTKAPSAPPSLAPTKAPSPPTRDRGHGLLDASTTKGEVSGTDEPTRKPTKSPTTLYRTCNWQLNEVMPGNWGYWCYYGSLINDPDATLYDCRCGHGQGSCHDDEDCKDWHKCVHGVADQYTYNVRPYTTPWGTYTTKTYEDTVGICIDQTPTTKSPTKSDEQCDGMDGVCSLTCPCGEGQGSCFYDDPEDVYEGQHHDRCKPGLGCGKNNGESYGYHEDVDVCIVTASPTPVPSFEVTAEPTVHPTICKYRAEENGDFNYCSEECPCAEGEGSCGYENEGADGRCAGDLVCGENNGAEFGFGEFTDFCISAEDACRRRYRRLQKGNTATKKTSGLEDMSAKEAKFMAWCLEQEAGKEKDDGQEGGGDVGINLPGKPIKLETGDDGQDDGDVTNMPVGDPIELETGEDIESGAQGFYCPSCSCRVFRPPKFVDGAMTTPSVEIADESGSVHTIDMTQMSKSDLTTKLAKTGVSAAVVQNFVNIKLKAWTDAQNKAAETAASDLIEGLKDFAGNEPEAVTGKDIESEATGFYCPSCSCCVFRPPKFVDGAMTTPSVEIADKSGSIHTIGSKSDLTAKLAKTGVSAAVVQNFINMELKAWTDAQNAAGETAASDVMKDFADQFTFDMDDFKDMADGMLDLPGGAENEPEAITGEDVISGKTGYSCPSCSCCVWRPPWKLNGAMNDPSVEVDLGEGKERATFLLPASVTPGDLMNQAMAHGLSGGFENTVIAFVAEQANKPAGDIPADSFDMAGHFSGILALNQGALRFEPISSMSGGSVAGHTGGAGWDAPTNVQPMSNTGTGGSGTIGGDTTSDTTTEEGTGEKEKENGGCASFQTPCASICANPARTCVFTGVGMSMHAACGCDTGATEDEKEKEVKEDGDKKECASVEEVVRKCESARKDWGWTCTHPDLENPTACGQAGRLRDPDTNKCVPECLPGADSDPVTRG